MSERQPKPRDWCNCTQAIRALRKLQRVAKEVGDEREEARICNEIAGHDYAHETGRCRFEYDAAESPIVDD